MFDQWEAQKMAIIQMWADVYLYSNLTPDQVKTAQITPVEDISTTVTQLIEHYDGNPSIAVLAEGPMTIPFIKETD